MMPAAAENLALLQRVDVTEAIRAHAVAQYPDESCGMITRGGYVPLANVAQPVEGVERSGPRFAFDCAAELAPHLVRGDVLALVHSHPDGPEGPSSKDMRQQRAMDLPWGIVMADAERASVPYFWGDMLAPPPLEGRPFRHGPSGTDGKGDCGALVRDWYRLERGVLINDYARDDEWWRHGQALYLDNYFDAGFRQADATDPRRGDLILMAIRSDTANHAAIYIGDHLLLHHLERRLSRIEPVLGWHKHRRAWLRHESAPAVAAS